uniref:Shieldin complex subunit 2 C-terminal domain-containing protein n=1 Tax=Neogobius melanostomus TaxID=47308 RepID=A0A8C6TCT5_9GOBI
MAPSALSVPDEAAASKSSHVSAAWTHVDISWQDGKLRTDPSGQQLPAVNKTTLPLPIADDVHNPSASTEDECSASILEYLESCFPQKKQEALSASTALSHQTRYLSTWTLSQALVLRGSQSASAAKTKKPSSRTPPQGSSTSYSSTPELFSPSKSASAAHQTDSVELFTPLAPSLGAEDCVLLQTTAEGLLCSQGQETHERPSKRARLSDELKFEDNTGSAEAGPTTILAQCVKPGALYSVLVAVVHPCHLKEIRMKSGTRIPLASIIVTDQSRVEMKVALWRRAAFWVLTVSPGDVLLITELQINEDTWRGETILRSTYNSKLLNMGRVPPPGSLTGQTLAPTDVLCPLLSLCSLTDYSRCRAALERWAVVRVQQLGGQQGALVLWGVAVDWLPRFTRDTVWDFHNLLVREGTTFDSPELHVTPWSSVQALDRSDPRMNNFIKPHGTAAGSTSVELDLRTLLSQKYSGEVELRVQVESFHFQPAPLSPDAPLILGSSSSAADALRVLGADVTYTGCGHCGAELDTDSNGIYCPCYPCLPHTSVRCYYRPAALRLSDCGEHQMCVQVPPVLLQKILNAPPDKLCRSSVPGSEVKHIELAAQRLHNLLSLPKRSFTVRVQSHFLCDENSVPLCQEFILLDLQLPL